ncbi:hypothetical protein C1886_15500 [Pseudomonas sp. FW300-N1A1]|nr:hypothetical protein C1886_15500 [Pseudomonas sp. FW300-N1A1]
MLLSQGQGCSIHPPWRASLLALGCTAAPTSIVEFVLKDRNRFVGYALRTSASKLARHVSHWLQAFLD